MLDEPGPLTLDGAVAALAVRQHGFVATRQLIELGVTARAISLRARNGRLHRIHRGVYAVGHRVLTRRATRPGLRIHRPRMLPADETTTKRGIPVSTPARTILDMPARLAESRLEYLLDQTEIQELTDYPALPWPEPTPPRGDPPPRSPEPPPRRHRRPKGRLEILFKDLCRTHGIPQPRINHRILGKEVDFFFEPVRLVVETDSRRYHRTRAAFEDDRARDGRLARAGYRTLRFTDRQLEDDPRTVAATVRAQLEAPG